MKTFAASLFSALLLPLVCPAASQTSTALPPGTTNGNNVITVLPNGNFLVRDSGFDQQAPPVGNVGAVRLYSPQGVLISTLTGSQANDTVGIGSVVVLANGHFVVRSQFWNNGGTSDAGAVTWGHAETGWGIGQVVAVSAANSLVGTQADDEVGSNGVYALPNGNYVVSSDDWNNGAAVDAGAATWGNGLGGTVGVVSAANSLVGTQTGDLVSGEGISVLTNGNYVVSSRNWNNGVVVDAGAATWGNGQGGTVGAVSAANSLVGSQTSDWIGLSGAIELTNGNYVVKSANWDNGALGDAGAAVWCNGLGGTVGPVSAANALVGTQANDRVGDSITALPNGNYVVISTNWNNGAVTFAGAVTWGNGQGGTVGPVTPANSLVGSQAIDSLGQNGVRVLANGHFVVISQSWDNGGVINAGAATWCNGLGGTVGPVTSANSLVGSQANDNVGASGVYPLTNGNYVVGSALWNNGGTADAGAATWCNGLGGTVGPVTSANSLVGSQTGDQVGASGVLALTNGNYVVNSFNWDNGPVVNAGAVTWGDGSKGVRGPVTAANSLVGTQANDMVSSFGSSALNNGNYVVVSPSWNHAAIAEAGAVTWGDGAKGTRGPVSPENSLVGTQANDRVGLDQVAVLNNGNYVVNSSAWDNGAVADAGAVTWGHGQGGTAGPVSAVNSLVGTQANDLLGFGSFQSAGDGNYVFFSSEWDNGAIADARAVTFGNGLTGTMGQISSANSVVGLLPSSNLSFSYDPERQQVIVADPTSLRLVILKPDQLYSLAKVGQDAPGAADLAYGAPGALAVDAAGETLFEAALLGSGAKTGKLGLFAPGSGGVTEMVLRLGDPVSALGFGLPVNATVASLALPVRQGGQGGLFQATTQGTGLKATNNRLLLLDAPGGVRALLRSGVPVTALGGASLNRPLEVAQSHDQDAIALTYALNQSGAPIVVAGNDTGLLMLRHDGSVQGGVAAREADPAFGGGGFFGQFTGRVAAGQGQTVHFSALFKPTVGNAVPALFRTTLDGVTTARTATLGDNAPGAAPATFGSFKGLSQMGADALFTATLKGSPANANEGLWRGDGSPVLTRKGDLVNPVNMALPGVTFARLLRFWPAGSNRVLIQAQLSDKTQALILRQENASHLLLMRTGGVMPGVGTARLGAISAVDVDPVTGHYAVLGTLSGAPAASNQALWSGNANLGSATTETVYRLPVLRLRKGQVYRTENTPQSLLRGISLRPALDPSGAGGRGLAQVIGSGGAIALVLTGDRKLTEAVVLR